MTKHRFYNELEEKEQKPLQGHYHLLVVGTFNAEDGEGRDNDALWFYGRPANEFWCFLPRMIDKLTLHQVDSDLCAKDLVEQWKLFCLNNKIIIVDIFKIVYKNLLSHKDSELEKLNDGDYLTFDFKKAFKDATFDGVLFTWKGQNNNTLTKIKQEIELILRSKTKCFLHMVTPGNSYTKPRSFKLKAWKEEYSKLKEKMDVQ